MASLPTHFSFSFSIHTNNNRRPVNVYRPAQPQYTDEDLERILNHLHEVHMEQDAGPPPASKHAIQNLHKVVITKRQLGAVGAASGLCTICFDPYQVGETKVCLPCSHDFHKDCAENWLRRHNTCPICRFSLEPEADQPQPTNGRTLSQEDADDAVLFNDHRARLDHFAECAAVGAACCPGDPFSVFDAYEEACDPRIPNDQVREQFAPQSGRDWRGGEHGLFVNVMGNVVAMGEEETSFIPFMSAENSHVRLDQLHHVSESSWRTILDSMGVPHRHVSSTEQLVNLFLANT